ncbi:MAG TPA: sulfatase/phosphatase domain-containing protein, partial [Bacteroidales bacterium]|nr:sulfatase/phosphatase domain-containing protein [Bacteroidales bacterium]
VLAGNEASDREDIFWHYPHYHTSGWKPGAAIRSGDWKLVLFYEDNSVELYDLRNDLAEQHNLAGTNAQKAEELLSKLKKMQQQTGALMPLSNKATAIE